MMENHIRAYVDELFEHAPNTQKAYEMKVELTENLIEKYNALLAEGKIPDDAYNLTILSIGDVNELFGSLADEQVEAQVIQAARTKAAGGTAVAVMIYILSLIPVILFGNNFGVIAMFLMWALATGLIIFVQMSKPKEVVSHKENVVAEFKDWKSRNNNRKQIKKAISSILWPMIVVVYFLISFATMKWYITWVIFLLGAAVEGLISAFFNLTSDK